MILNADKRQNNNFIFVNLQMRKVHNSLASKFKFKSGVVSFPSNRKAT